MLITRPRRWGKTTILTMVQTFFEINRTKEESLAMTQCFSKLKIGKEKKNYLEEIGTSPILFMTFSCQAETYEGFLEMVKRKIQDLFLDNWFICKELKKEKDEMDPILKLKIDNFERLCGLQGGPNEDDLKSSLLFLVDLLYNHFKKTRVMVLIDEIDFPLLQLIERNIDRLSSDDPNSQIRKYLNKIQDFMSSIIGPIVKVDNPHNSLKIRQIILTGITDLFVSLSSSLVNDIRKYTMLDLRYQEFYGATESEITQLLDQILFEAKSDEKQEILNDIKRWYNGYSCSTNKVPIYNVYSIMNYFSDFIVHYRVNQSENFLAQGYWTTSSISEIFRNSGFLEKLNPNFIKKLNDLFIDKTVASTEFNPRSDDIIKFIKGFELKIEKALPYLLLHTGYITEAKNYDTEELSYYYSVPNNEILLLYSQDVFSVYLHHKIKITDKELEIFSEKLNTELNNDELFCANVQENILDHMKNCGNLNEISFESMIYAILNWHFIHNPLKALYQPSIEKTVEGGGIIDGFHWPNNMTARSNYTIIIHEYKYEVSTGQNNIQSAKEQAFWQILAKNYLLEPLSKYSFCKYKQIWEVKVRPIVFHKNENENNWQMSMDTFVFCYEEVSKILSFFQNKIPKDLKNCLADEKHKTNMLQQRKNLLKYYDVSSIYELIELIKIKKEIEIRDFKTEKEDISKVSENKRNEQDDKDEEEDIKQKTKQIKK